jgi:hypothetical protein
LPNLGRIRSRFRVLLLVTGIVATSATAISAVPDAQATNEPYSCSSCYNLNGPELYIKWSEGTDYTFPGVIDVDWEHKSNGQYTEKASAESSGYTAKACYTGGEYYGHGHTATKEDFFENYKDHRAGREENTSC